MRGARGTPFTELGTYASLSDAAEAIQKVENNDNGIFFRVWVDPISAIAPESDAAALSSLDYQTVHHYYSLTRDTH